MNNKQLSNCVVAAAKQCGLVVGITENQSHDHIEFDFRSGSNSALMTISGLEMLVNSDDQILRLLEHRVQNIADKLRPA